MRSFSIYKSPKLTFFQRWKQRKNDITLRLYFEADLKSVLTNFKKRYGLSEQILALFFDCKRIEMNRENEFKKNKKSKDRVLKKTPLSYSL
ncbi:hypothetical protein DLM75_03350 [Leptospira stimsonii]|uniref:Uncharacterized protein n=1 Tax=Leptospira stimsonii TaxID=2202203 RepID=A0A396ZCK0_9LEPT|nr:hypothetical protein DLM75_03350 [Leptospira stimsonii]